MSYILFTGVWIALEDVLEGSGEQIYFPGSHHWGDFLFSGRFKHYEEERDGSSQLDQWYLWLHQQAAARGTPVAHFLPKKGDVLFWHADLAHGGAEIKNRAMTRRSLVAHYCPQGVRPIYHYYKPGQRKVYIDDQRRYTSSYYRR